MLAARASAVLALAVGGWTLAGAALGQQPTNTIQPAGAVQPAMAMVETSVQPSANNTPVQAAWMPSRLTGHLADRLQALHEPLAIAEPSRTLPEKADASQSEAAARTPRNPSSETSVAVGQSKLAATLPPSTLPPSNLPPPSAPASEPKPAASAPSQISIIAPQQPAATPPRNLWTAQRPSLGGTNPLRGDH